MRKVKILATIGPASDSPACISSLIKEGVNGVRLNFSHGTREEHAAACRAVREAAAELGVPVAVVADLQGPKIRVGEMAAPVEAVTGGRIEIVAPGGCGTGGAASIPCSYAGLGRDVRPGDRILVDDGLVELRVEAVEEGRVVCRVVEGGTIRSRKGINLPGVHVSISSITPKDEEDLRFALSMGVDYVAVSFVRTGAGLARVREVIREEGADVLVVAKIEKPEALEHIDAIMERSDGLMIARGDLAVETSFEEVPGIQKQLVRETNRRGKIDIVATQMLQSMVENPSPTRAEASDVANAVLDGADVLMLSGETAVGAHPVRAVAFMRRIIAAAEKSSFFHKHVYAPDEEDDTILNGITHAAGLAADETRASAVVIYSRRGDDVLMMSKKRPETPVVACTPEKRLYDRFGLFYGVVPVLCRDVSGWENAVSYLAEELPRRGVTPKGRPMVCLVDDGEGGHVMKIVTP